MPILTKEVEIKVNGKTVDYYKSLGYEIPMKKASKSYYKKTKKEFIYDLDKTFKVKVDDLQKGSNIKIDVLCDYCHKEILSMTYDQYIQRTKEVNKIACRKCYMQKVKEVSLLRYGVDSYTKTIECREKYMSTMLAKYGVKHNSQLPDYREKFHNTCVERYGENYRNQFTKGLKSSEAREKRTKTLYANSSQMASKQQRYICELYRGVLNFPIKHYNIDVYLPNDNIVVEYDGGGHMLNVIMGQETIEEYNRKEIVRYNVIKKEGCKQIKIISKNDLLPSDDVLLQMLLTAKEYFNTTSHTWVSFDIDNSKMINIENKNIGGIFFDYGELHKIKNYKK